MTRNLVDAEQTEYNRGRVGAYTFNAPVPNGYEGHSMTFGCVRLGDHAHVHVDSGRAVRRPFGEDARISGGWAGKLLLRWPEWLLLREILDGDPRVWVAEVENPTRAMLDRYTADHAPRRSPLPTEAL